MYALIQIFDHIRQETDNYMCIHITAHIKLYTYDRVTKA